MRLEVRERERRLNKDKRIFCNQKFLLFFLLKFSEQKKFNSGKGLLFHQVVSCKSNILRNETS
jgi:hypothetical protein